MRALVIGRGSMGRRRIRDLTALGVEVDSWDPIEEPGSPRNLRGPWDTAIISTPPLTHRLFETMSAYRFTEADVESDGRNHFPSATPLFTEWYERIDRRAHSYQLTVRQHLDDWHPGADPATYYAYQNNLALREMLPFELIWLTKKFGPVIAERGRTIPGKWLGADVKHASGTLGVIFIDVANRPSARDFLGQHDGWHQGLTLSYSESDYLAEMRAFVAAVKGEAPWPYTQEEERANLEVLHTIERS